MPAPEEKPPEVKCPRGPDGVPRCKRSPPKGIKCKRKVAVEGNPGEWNEEEGDCESDLPVEPPCVEPDCDKPGSMAVDSFNPKMLLDRLSGENPRAAGPFRNGGFQKGAVAG